VPLRQAASALGQRRSPSTEAWVARLRRQSHLATKGGHRGGRDGLGGWGRGACSRS
jgi:hypothetical protein